MVLRVAAQRDHDIFAIVCRGGLIDLAGMMYLHLLASPLLVLVGQDDERRVVSTRRALRELACPNELQLLPASADSPRLWRGFRVGRSRNRALVRATPANDGRCCHCAWPRLSTRFAAPLHGPALCP